MYEDCEYDFNITCESQYESLFKDCLAYEDHGQEKSQRVLNRKNDIFNA